MSSRKKPTEQPTSRKRVLSDIEKLEKKRLSRARERDRAQSAFSTIYTTMGFIQREEVSHSAIELWRQKINMFRNGITIKIKDFLVNAEQGDPFNADAPAQKALAHWFVEQWHRFKPGATTVHVRGLHYAISALAGTPDAVYLPNGKLYDNTEIRWQDLQRAGKYARYLGLLPPEIFQDRRSREPDVKSFATEHRSLDVAENMYEFAYFNLSNIPDLPDFPCLPDFPSPPEYRLGLRGQQRYRLEVWIEKSTQEDVIVPVCNRHQITLLTAQGEISISSIWKAIARAEQYGTQTTTVILYLSDFDPAGKSMPVAASRKLEYLRMLKQSPVDIRLYPIALTHEQCIHYQLPRTPIKETDAKRGVFEERYGSGATELDALESLHPGELAKLLERAIHSFRDNTIHSRMDARWNEIAKELTVIQRSVRDEYDMDTLEEEYEQVKNGLVEIEEAHESFRPYYRQLEESYDEEVRSKFDEWYTDVYTPFQNRLRSSMREVTMALQDNMPDINAYTLPKAQEIPVNGDCLFSSDRTYVDQLAAYKQFSGKFSHLEENEDDGDNEIA
jgi:hypothetical protein